jgi:hypothetical protein
MRKSIASLCLAGLAAVSMSGCAPHLLRSDFKGYEAAYADSSNRQILLNLARLNQHHPTYFFKLGQISTSYRMQAGINGNGTYSPTGAPRDVGGGGTPNLLYEKDPQFTFIPINDDNVAQQLLRPIRSEHFYVLFQQGWRLDQLLRLMVDRIEYKPASGGASQVIRNTPSADNIAGYLTFLRISAIVYYLQQHGYLLLTAGKATFEARVKGIQTEPRAQDIQDAVSKNLIWQKEKEGWALGSMMVEPKFQLNLGNKSIDTIATEIRNYSKELDVDSLGPTLSIIQSGFSVQGDFASDQSAKEEKGSAQLVMRSLIGAMAAAAQEQETFDELMTKIPAGQAQPPAEERRPLLRLTWGDGSQLTPSLVQLNYLGKSYAIADKQTDSTLTTPSWNRDLFRIITQLSAQVTVDISKFPLPEILQLRTQ